MKKNTLKALIGFSCFLLTLNVNAQRKQSNTLKSNASNVLVQNNKVPDHRNCGLEQHEQELLDNPAYAKSFYERQAKFEQKVQEIHQQKMNGTYKKATLYIPVAVHFEAGNESDRACLEAMHKHK